MGLEYRIEYSNEALAHLSELTKRQQSLVLGDVQRQLQFEPTIRTRNRKPLRPNPLAPWELRIGGLRVYYDVDDDLVEIKAIGLKVRNVVLIAGKAVQL